MDPNRKLWNQQQQALLRALSRPDDHQKAIELFLSQHAMLHSAKMARLQQVMAEGAIVEAASGIADYWGKRTIAGLLLMPPTRHNFVHLNEALRIKYKL